MPTGYNSQAVAAALARRRHGGGKGVGRGSGQRAAALSTEAQSIRLRREFIRLAAIGRTGVHRLRPHQPEAVGAGRPRPRIVSSPPPSGAAQLPGVRRFLRKWVLRAYQIPLGVDAGCP